ADEPESHPRLRFTVPNDAAGKTINTMVVGVRDGADPRRPFFIEFNDIPVAAAGTPDPGTPTGPGTPLTNTTTPRVNLPAAPRPGAVLRAHPGTWSRDAGFGYQWMRGNQPIAGATAATYRLTPADAGR